MRSKHLDQNIDRLYHPEKGVARSNNERRWCNKFPDEPPTANHNIAGTSKIWTETVHDTAVSPSKHFKPPNNANKFVNENDKSGKPNYWSIDGQLIVSQTGHALCSYCGIPYHSREICRLRMQDEVEGKSYNAHPNRGKILSKNQSTKQLQPKGHPTKYSKNIRTTIRIGPDQFNHKAGRLMIKTRTTTAGITTTTHLSKVGNTWHNPLKIPKPRSNR